MNFELLNKDQIKNIYENRMVEDFPPHELKPLNMIFDVMDQGKYICFGLLDGEDIAGYVFLLKNGDDYLVDYLATAQERRNNGLGGVIISHFNDYLYKVGAKSIILEVENPEFATSEEERNLQKRRYGFYMRNGFKDTSVKVKCFKADFILLETGRGLNHSEDEIRALYEMQLRSIISADKFEKNVVI